MIVGQQVREYILEAKIGEGGMAEVWRARHAHLDKRVALKVMMTHPGNEESFRERFLREAKAMATLQHPNILSASDFFFEGGTYFLVLPYVDQGNLEDLLIKQSGPLPVAQALSISQQVLAALDYAHQQGIIHRDVKPSNILLDSQERAFLADFGIALMVGEDRRTRTGTSIGTPHYMSPEQIMRPRTMDHRADVYSFGCVLYEMLTGSAPFEAKDQDGDTDLIIKNAHLQGRATPPRKLNPAIPAKLESLVMKAMEKEPNRRFQGCGEFSQALVSLQDPPAEPRKGPTTNPLGSRTSQQGPVPVAATSSPRAGGRNWYFWGIGGVAAAAVVAMVAVSTSSTAKPLPLPSQSSQPSQPGPDFIATNFQVVGPTGTNLGGANTFQEALDRAPQGGMVRIGAREIQGSFHITKSLTLMPLENGKDVLITSGRNTDPVLSIAAPGVRLSGLRVTHTGENNALYVKSGDTEASDCTFSSPQAAGVYATGAGTKVTLHGGTVQDCGENGVCSNDQAAVKLNSVTFRRTKLAAIGSQKYGTVDHSGCNFEPGKPKIYTDGTVKVLDAPQPGRKMGKPVRRR